MTLGGFAGVLLFVVVAVMTPGANNVMAATSGARFGLRGSAPLLLGLWTSMVAAIAVSAAGLGALLGTLPALVVALRVAGTAYLLWLAHRIAASGRPGGLDGTGGTGGAPPGFRAGVMVTWLNPKAWTVAITAAVSFSRIADPLLLAAVLTGTFAVVMVPNLVLWCAGGQVLGRVLRTERQWRILNGTLAALLVVSIIPMWVG